MSRHGRLLAVRVRSFLPTFVRLVERRAVSGEVLAEIRPEEGVGWEWGGMGGREGGGTMPNATLSITTRTVTPALRWAATRAKFHFSFIVRGARS